MQAIDTASSVLGHVSGILASGRHGVLRYVSPNSEVHPSKCLSLAEARAIHAVDGMKIGLVYERGADQVEYFTIEHANHDAADALRVCDELGVPVGCPVFFAVDFDVNGLQLARTVSVYFGIVHRAFKQEGRLIGVYGAGSACGYLVGYGLVHWTWLAQSTGWAGYSNWLNKADIVQGPSGTVAGLSVDTDEVRNVDLLW